MAYLNLANWIDNTEVEGPGKRSAIWVQGCTIRCPGCCNPGMFDLVSNQLKSSSEVIEWISQAHKQYDTEGVTFLGGEPMLQARGLAEVARGCRDLNLSVMVFSGYTMENLKHNPMPGVLDLLAATDLLIDGPFLAEKPDIQRNWVGSMNQRFHFLTDYYSQNIIPRRDYAYGLEVRISDDGSAKINGHPEAIKLINLIEIPKIPRTHIQKSNKNRT